MFVRVTKNFPSKIVNKYDHKLICILLWLLDILLHISLFQEVKG